ncbi:MAG TPA: hypothetical protein VMW43_00715 [Bacteroidota bacterium]|nr:hypothetical protein [Bacteroidota bacterium]
MKKNILILFLLLFGLAASTTAREEWSVRRPHHRSAFMHRHHRFGRRIRRALRRHHRHHRFGRHHGPSHTGR